MKACTIYKTSNKLLVICMHETDAKLYKLSEPIITLESWDNSSAVGNAILEVISCSQSGLPAATTGLGVVPVILKAAGVKSWRKLEADVTECVAEFDGATVLITPCLKTGGSSRPHLVEERVNCMPSAERIGATVVRLIAASDSFQ
jgi:hypothetical protein